MQQARSDTTVPAVPTDPWTPLNYMTQSPSQTEGSASEIGRLASAALRPIGITNPVFQSAGGPLSKFNSLSQQDRELINWINTDRGESLGTVVARKNLTKADLMRIAPFLAHVKIEPNFQYDSAEFLYDFIKNCSNLKTLFIKSNKIKKLPAELPHCTIFDCRGCKQLTAVPAVLPNCTHFDCSYCPQLGAVPAALPKCTYFNCSDCDQLGAVPAVLPKCTEFNSSRCLKLRAVPEALPCCIKFNCSSCPQLRTVLAQLPICTIFDCRNCPQLRSVPAELPNCTIFNCSYCPQLGAVPAALPNCTKFYCQACVQLRAVPAELPNCTEFYCHACRQLRAVPAALPRCTYFGCTGCLSIGGIPELPGRATVYSSLAHTILDIALSDLNNHPEKVLDQLATWFSENHHFPRIQFVDAEGLPSAGVDLGGLRRHLVSVLIQNLFKDSASEAASADGVAPDRLSFYRYPESRQVLPEITGPKDSSRWETVGKLFAFAYRDSLLIGTYFSPKLFSALFTLLGPPETATDGTDLLPILALLKLSGRYLYVEKALTNPSSLSEEEKRELDELCTDYLLSSEDQSEVRIAFESNIARESQLGGLPCLKILPALQALAKGMESVPGFALPTSAAELQRKIEGELSNGAVLESLQFAGFLEGAKSPDLLKEWVRKASQENLALFLKAVTGSSSLVPGATKLEITYDRHHPNGLPVAHTCFYRLELPEHNAPQKQPGKPELFATLQESFDHSMALFLQHALAKTGFTLA